MARRTFGRVQVAMARGVGMGCDVTPRCAGMDEGRAVCNVCMLGVLGYITSSSQECPTRDVEYHARWSGSPSSSPQPPRTVVSAL